MNVYDKGGGAEEIISKKEEKLREIWESCLVRRLIICNLHHEQLELPRAGG
jgi:hypothetical protein